LLRKREKLKKKESLEDSHTLTTKKSFKSNFGVGFVYGNLMSVWHSKCDIASKPDLTQRNV